MLDSSKAIAAGVLYQGDVWDLFLGKATIAGTLPVFDILRLIRPERQLYYMASTCATIQSRKRVAALLSINSSRILR